MNNKTMETNEENNLLDIISENAQQFSKLSFEFEEKREASLISQSSQMLTCFSIISAVLSLLTPLLIDHVKTVPISYIMICVGITLLILIASMILALLVQWRYKYQALPSPLAIYTHMVDENKEFFSSGVQRNKSWIETMDISWNSKRKLDDKRVKLIKASMIVFFCSIGFVLSSAVFAYIAFFV